MRSLVGRALVALLALTALSTTTSPLPAQGAKVDPCSLLSLAEVKQVTGNKSYAAGQRGEPGDGVGGGDPCSFTASSKLSAPTVSVISIPPRSRGRRYFDWLKYQKPTPGCAKSPVPGLGVEAFFEECAGYASLPLYMRGTSYDVVVGIQMSRAGEFAAHRPTVLALAKAVAPKIR